MKFNKIFIIDNNRIIINYCNKQEAEGAWSCESKIIIKFYINVAISTILSFIYVRKGFWTPPTTTSWLSGRTAAKQSDRGIDM